MRILKYIFLLLILAFIGITVYVATQRGDFNVTKSSIINTPRSTVFEYVNDYKNWETFGSWMQKNNQIKFNYPAKTMGAGGRFSWTKNSAVGDIKTVFVKENDSIAQKINYDGNAATLSWTFKDTVGGTKVTVNSKGKMDLMTKIISFFKGGITSIVGDASEKSLRNLNTTLKYEMKTYTIKVNGIVQRPSGFCIKQTATCDINNVSKNIKIMMPRMLHFFNKNKITMTGKPFVIYDKYDVSNKIVTISVCIPIGQQISVSDESDVQSGEIIGFTCLKTTLTGDYSHRKEAWAKAQKYIVDNGFKHNFAGSYSEVYVKTIDDVKQPSQWITEIYIPVFPKVIELPKPLASAVSTPVIPTPKLDSTPTDEP